MTNREKSLIRKYILNKHSDQGADSVRIHADGAVSVRLDKMPNTNQAGRIFAGWAEDLLREAQS